MNILLATIPDGPLHNTIETHLSSDDTTQSHVWMPHGVLRIEAYMKQNGYDCNEIYDIGNLRGDDATIINNLKKIKPPTVVGLGAGLTHCYPNLKRISKIVRDLFPDCWVVTGGAITSSANVILNKTDVDICVVGDGEIPFLKFVKYIEKNPRRKSPNFQDLSSIQGLAFLSDNKKLKVTGNGEPLTADEASEIHYPDYSVMRKGLEKFHGDGDAVNKFFGTIKDLEQIKEFFAQQIYPDGLKFFKKSIGKKVAEIRSAQGCVARCTFCQRYIKGYRSYKIKDLESHVIELKEKYNVALLFLNDENSLSNKKRSYEMAKVFKKHDMYWTAQGVRANTCSYEDLKYYKEHNLLAVRYGIESGSQKILDIMEKKITTDDAKKALKNCRDLEIGVATDMFMLGMPGETDETVKESAKLSGYLRYSVGKDWNIENTPLAMAIPGTPLYEYAQQIGSIGKTLDEEEDYLIRTSEFSNKDILTYTNKTDASIEDVHYWTYLYRFAGKKDYLNNMFKSNKSIIQKIIDFKKNCIDASISKINIYYDKNEKSFSQKIRKQANVAFQIILTFAILLLPRKFLFFLLKKYAYSDFAKIKKLHKEKSGKQKHNCFVEKSVQNSNLDEYKISDKKISLSTRKIDLSLRKIVSENRAKINPALTDEQSSMQILAEGQ